MIQFLVPPTLWPTCCRRTMRVLSKRAARVFGDFNLVNGMAWPKLDVARANTFCTTRMCPTCAFMTFS